MNAKQLLDALWRDFAASTPQAERIHALLTARGESVRHDHIVLRTFGAPGIGVVELGRPFEAHGWELQPDVFVDKHVRARYWQHADPTLPTVLVSELVLDEMPPALQMCVRAMVSQIPPEHSAREDLAWAARPWSVTHADYRALFAESEHAAWVAAFGARVHHFTVDVNALSTFPDLTALGAYLGEHGFTLDTGGGRSSTRADSVDVGFDDATVRIHSGRYELLKRDRSASGERFPGFVSRD